MYFKYGTYQHANNEVGLRGIARQALEENGIIYGYRETWALFGQIHAADAGALTTALGLLEAAYTRQGQTAAFYEDGGTTTKHRLTSASAIGGVRVINPIGYETSTGAEYTTFRNYTMSLEGTIFDNSILTILWEEVLSFAGGGPQKVFLEPINGPPQVQLVKQATTYKALQTGRAIGLRNWIGVPSPKWPAHEHWNLRNISYALPSDRFGQPGFAKFARFETSWSYQFESISRLVGFPTSWPA